MVQLLGSVLLSAGSLRALLLVKMINSIANSYVKELKNINITKEKEYGDPIDDLLIDAGLNTLVKKVNALGETFEKANSSISGSGITVKNNKSSTAKAIRSFENKEVLSKGLARKVSSQERGFLNFRRPLITAG